MDSDKEDDIVKENSDHSPRLQKSQTVNLRLLLVLRNVLTLKCWLLGEGGYPFLNRKPKLWQESLAHLEKLFSSGGSHSKLSMVLWQICLCRCSQKIFAIFTVLEFSILSGDPISVKMRCPPWTEAGSQGTCWVVPWTRPFHRYGALCYIIPQSVSIKGERFIEITFLMNNWYTDSNGHPRTHTAHQ
jgi:hypothetical protein